MAVTMSGAQVAQPQQPGDIRGRHLLGRRDLRQGEHGRLHQPIMDREGTPQQPDQPGVGSAGAGTRDHQAHPRPAAVEDGWDREENGPAGRGP